MIQVFDLDIIYDDGTKETIPMIKGIVYNVIMDIDELLVLDMHTGISRVKKLHTNPIRITIKNIRKVSTNKDTTGYDYFMDKLNE